MSQLHDEPPYPGSMAGSYKSWFAGAIAADDCVMFGAALAKIFNAQQCDISPAGSERRIRIAVTRLRSSASRRGRRPFAAGERFCFGYRSPRLRSANGGRSTTAERSVSLVQTPLPPPRWICAVPHECGPAARSIVLHCFISASLLEKVAFENFEMSKPEMISVRRSS